MRRDDERFLGFSPRTDSTSKHLQSLVQEFAIEVDVKSKVELADRIGVEATEESIDGQTILWTIDRVTKRGRQQGALVLNRIAEYFEKNEWVFKAPMLALGRNAKKDLEQFKHTLEGAEEGLSLFSANRYIDGKHAQTLHSVVRELRLYWEVSARGRSPHILTAARPLTVNPEDIATFNRLNIEEDFTTLFHVISDFRHQGRKEGWNEQLNGYLNEVELPAVLIPALESISKKVSSKGGQMFDLYRKKFMGISLQDLVNDTRFDSANYQDLLREARRINTYLGSIPKGDLVWYLLASSMFITPFILVAPVTWDRTPEDAFGVPNWFAKVLSFHEYFGCQIYLPEITKFYGNPLPSDFEKGDIESAKRFIRGIDPKWVSAIAYYGVHNSVHNKRIFHPAEDINSLMAKSPFYSMAHGIVGLQTEEEMAVAVLEPLMPQLRQSRGNEFADWSKRLSTLEEYQQSQLKWVREWSQNRFGETFLDELRKNTRGMSEVTRRILNGSYDLSVSRWGEMDVDVEVQMDRESLARKLGIVASIWEFPSEQKKDIHFVLRSDHPALELSGIINLDSREIKLRYLDYQDDWQFFSTTMKLVAAATLHDLLGRKQTSWKRSRKEDVEAVKKWPIRLFPKIRALPRKWFMLRSKDLIDDFMHPTKKSGGTETQELFTPRYVNAHTRRVPYGAVMEALINKYNELNLSEDERQRLLTNIRNLRDGTDPKGRVLGKPDPAKFEKLPLAFQKELRPVIDPDGNALYTRTFVAPHFNPSLSTGDYSNLMSLYHATYETHGSALAFLESAIAEISGMEH